MSSPRISVAMATYNGISFLPEQLASLAAQSRLPDELVVCDDCSTDSTINILEDFQLRAPFEVVVVRNEERLGLVKNFEKAAGLCTGDLVFLCDQDDVWFDEKLMTVGRLFLNAPTAAVIMNDALLVDAKLASNGKTQLASLRKCGLPDTLFNTGCCSAHRREWQQLAWPIPAAVAGHDLWINRLAHELGCSSISEAVLQLYRRHGDNLSNSMLSDPDGVSAAHALLHHGLEDAREGWRREAELLDLIVERVRSRPQVAANFVGQQLERQLERIEAKRDTVKRRIELCSAPRWRRAVPVLRLLARGGYRQALGWKSAAKDLVRP